jgi:hypothetical protein
VWVVSAGYGFISIEKEISSYDATFNSNNENSVSRFFSEGNLVDKNVNWWNRINKNILKGEPVGPLEYLYKNNLDDIFFFVVPPNYLKVLEPELDKLVTTGIINKKNTFIFSSKQNLEESLTSLFFAAKDDFCKYLGGSRISLNIRLASHILKALDLERAVAPQVEKLYNEILINSSPAKKYNRKKLSDKEVNDFIKSELKLLNIKNASASKLLRILRDKGMACEQKRFSKLYNNLSK